MKNWHVYIIHCSDGTLYTGISTDVEKRYEQHCKNKGAKYFRGRKPEQIVFIESDHNRSSATKREIEIKQLTRANKIKLISSQDNLKSNASHSFLID